MTDLESILVLEVPCLSCDGRRVNYNSEVDLFDKCDACNGTGMVPTAIGARILELVRHNSRVSVTAEFAVSSPHAVPDTAPRA